MTKLGRIQVQARSCASSGHAGGVSAEEDAEAAALIAADFCSLCCWIQQVDLSDPAAPNGPA